MKNMFLCERRQLCIRRGVVGADGVGGSAFRSNSREGSQSMTSDPYERGGWVLSRPGQWSSLWRGTPWTQWGPHHHHHLPQALNFSVTWPSHPHLHNTAPGLRSDWDLIKDMCVYVNPPDSCPWPCPEQPPTPPPLVPRLASHKMHDGVDIPWF